MKKRNSKNPKITQTRAKTQRAQSRPREKPAWNDSISDLNMHKLTRAELVLNNLPPFFTFIPPYLICL
jgi:hypothetical protein